MGPFAAIITADFWVGGLSSNPHAMMKLIVFYTAFAARQEVQLRRPCSVRPSRTLQVLERRQLACSRHLHRHYCAYHGELRRSLNLSTFAELSFFVL
jgi:hypothetical protein